MDGNADRPRVREDDGAGAGMIPADRIVPDAIAGAEGDPTLGDVSSGSAASTRTATPTAGLVADRARLAWRTLAADRARILATIAVVAIAAGGVLHAVGAGDLGHQVWRAAVALLAAELAFEVARTVVVDRHLGVDTIALVAMVGALALGEELAGAVIGLMFSGGAALEAAASRRARRELTQLVERAPRVAQLRVDGGLREVFVESVAT